MGTDPHATVQALTLSALFVLTALAGCIAGDTPGTSGAEGPVPDPGAEASWMPGPVPLADCREQFAIFPLPADRADPLPPGFEPVPYPGDPAGETVQLVTVAYTCERKGPDGDEAVSEMLGMMAVEPPESHRNGSIDAYFAVIVGATTSEAMNETYHAWGIPQIQQGPVSLALPAQTPAAGAARAWARLDGSPVRVNTTTPGPVQAGDPGKARLFGVDGASVTGAVDHDWNATETMGPGEARFDSDVIPVPVLPGMGHHAWGYDTVLSPVRDLPDLPGDEATLVPADPEEVTARTVPTGFQGGEPSIGSLPSGSLFVQAFDHTLRSPDGGRTWESVYNYTIDTVQGSYGTFDPMLWTDPATERVYWNHLAPDPAVAGGLCSAIGWSGDGGETWDRNDRACGTGGVDFQKLAGGPPGPDTNPAAGRQHPTVLYLCYNKQRPSTGQVPAPRTYDTHCSVSYDGGRTWPVESRTLDCPGCGGGAGRPTVAPDGTVYVPLGGQLAVSRDSGLTWTTIGDLPLWARQIAFTPDGTMYVLGTSNGVAHVARSPDGGQTWAGPWRASPKSVETTAFEAFATGDDGRLAVAAVGTNHSLADPVDAPDDARWHLHVTFADDADTDAPTFHALQATQDPVQVGPLCTRGACSDTGARNLLDFIDAAAGPNGTFYVSYADGCTGECATTEDPDPEDSRDSAASVAWLAGWTLRGDGGS